MSASKCPISKFKVFFFNVPNLHTKMLFFWVVPVPLVSARVVVMCTCATQVLLWCDHVVGSHNVVMEATLDTLFKHIMAQTQHCEGTGMYIHPAQYLRHEEGTGMQRHNNTKHIRRKCNNSRCFCATDATSETNSKYGHEQVQR